MNRCASLPEDLKKEWLDPRPPESVPRRQMVKWMMSGKEVEMTKENRLKRWKRKQPRPIVTGTLGNPATVAAVINAQIGATAPTNGNTFQTVAQTVVNAVNATQPGIPTEVQANDLRVHVDPLLNTARRANLLGSRIGSDTFMVLCPWRSQHQSGNQRNGQHDQSTQINTTEGTFICRHGSCKGKGAAEFLAELGQPGTPPVVNKTHILINQDVSGSMSWLTGEATVAINRILAQLHQDAQSLPHAKVTVTHFNHEIFERREYDIKDVLPRIEQISTGGGTALNDTVADSIDQATDHATSYLIITITDGKDEHSRYYRDPTKLRDKITKAIGTDRFTFAFLCPPGEVQNIVSNYQIPAGCVKAWDATDLGIKTMAQDTSQGVTEFMNQRAHGKTKLEKFFVDARKLSAELGTLTDITSVCKVLKVDREAVLQPFVEDAGLTFVLGANFYELTKPEVLRTNRAILVRQKGTRQILSGPNVRQVLGLPNDRECKVEPGDMGNLELFLESTSHNRMLVRGTEVIVRTDHQGSAHTWATPKG